MSVRIFSDVVIDRIERPAKRRPLVRVNEAKSGMVPALAGERIVEIDIVRAIALIGIVVVNYQSPNLTGAGYASHSGLDQIVNKLIQGFFDGKFYPLFSFLFGFGMSIQIMRARARAVAFVPFYLRRLAVLFVLGIIHAVFVWEGDILHVYAFWAIFLLMCRELSNRTLLTTALVLIGVWALRAPLLDLIHPNVASQAGAVMSAYGTAPTYVALIGTLFQKFCTSSVSLTVYVGQLDILGMFLLGLYAGRKGLFDNLGAHKLFIQRVTLGSLALGLIGMFWAPALWRLGRIAGDQSAFSGAISLLTSTGVKRIARLYYGQALAIFYCSGLLLLLEKQSILRWLRPLSSLGRMALTNYLMQCVIAAVIFFGFGFYSRLGSAAAAILALGVYALQVPFSAWWLRRYRFGPLEWVWRSLTYWQPQPMRAA